MVKYKEKYEVSEKKLDKTLIWFTYAVGIATGLILAIGITGVTNYKKGIYSKNEKVEQKFVRPSRLEIKCEDLDKDGKEETIVNIGDKSYLLIETECKPILSEYDVKIDENGIPAIVIK
jgi:hypothetical protein